jgi:hypothetical protein
MEKPGGYRFGGAVAFRHCGAAALSCAAVRGFLMSRAKASSASALLRAEIERA